jgi:hypothetical protein
MKTTNQVGWVKRIFLTWRYWLFGIRWAGELIPGGSFVTENKWTGEVRKDQILTDVLSQALKAFNGTESIAEFKVRILSVDPSAKKDS